MISVAGKHAFDGYRAAAFRPDIATLTINQLCEVTANAPKLVPSAVSGNAWEGPGASGTWEGLCRLPLLYEWFVEECENGPLVSDISRTKVGGILN